MELKINEITANCLNHFICERVKQASNYNFQEKAYRQILQFFQREQYSQFAQFCFEYWISHYILIETSLFKVDKYGLSPKEGIVPGYKKPTDNLNSPIYGQLLGCSWAFILIADAQKRIDWQIVYSLLDLGVVTNLMNLIRIANY